MSKTRLLLLASGGGSNAAQIMDYFAGHKSIEVVGVISDRKQAGVHEKARARGIASRFIGKTNRERAGGLLEAIQKFSPDYIVLAGYLKLIPQDVLAAFPNRVFNIHPSLLPLHGGAGMYGQNVHQAVRNAEDATSGMTIHLVNAEYDKGAILFQATTAIDAADSPEEIGRKVLVLEHKHYAPVLEAYILGQPVS